jgi:cytochrome c biogenesis protein CcmG, thiol:disulfide interchange protein DsbE
MLTHGQRRLAAKRAADREGGVTTRAQWFVVIGIVVLLGIGLVIASHAMRDQLAPVQVGTRAPDFRAQTLDARTTKSLADYRGQVVLLNIWATWCAPCVREMPTIERLYQEFGPEGLRVVAVSVDEGMDAQPIRDFISEHDLHFEVLHDASGAIQSTYQLAGLPETFLIGRDGVIRQQQFVWNWDCDPSRIIVAQLLGLDAPPPRDPSAACTISATAQTPAGS